MTTALDRINQLTNLTNTAPAPTFWACEQGHAGSGTMPDKCPECEARVWPGSTEQIAADRAKRATRTKVEAPKIVETEQPPVPVAAPTIDQSAIRKEAVKKFVAAHKLNANEFKRVGKGRIATPGFTVWTETENGRRPTYRWYEPSLDTPESFRAEIRQYHASIDVVLVSGLDAELKPLAYLGEIAANLNCGDGRLMVARAGDSVVIGAKVSSSGSIIWGVIEKIKEGV